MTQTIHRAHPVINLHRASEPASPVTIASTLSNHSTPAPSPARVTIISDNHSPTDFPLFDDGYALQEHQPKQLAPHPRYAPNTSNPSPTTATQFNGSFGEFHPLPWSRYSSQSMEHAKLQRQQQQYYHHNSTPTFNNRNDTFAHHMDDDELPALSPSRGTTSRPSISEVDMPATPIHSPIHRDGNYAQAPAIRETTYIVNCMNSCLQTQPDHSQSIPKLARTVSDAVQDELFNPGIAPGTTHSQPEHLAEPNSQLPTLFQQAQSQHAIARSTPVKPATMMRDHSPFRANSPFHPARTQQEIIPPPTRTAAFVNFGAYTSARSRRENEIERETEALREKMKQEYEEMQEDPKTISPKDAYIEYREPEGDSIQGSLFSSSQNDDSYSQHSGVDIKSESGRDSYHGSIQGDDEGHQTEHSYDSMTTSRRESDVSMADYNMSIYNSNTHQFGDHLTVPAYGWGEENSSQGSSEPSRPSDETYELSAHLHRPEDTKANDGAYSCTVHGCTQRFSTASKMSKHRREAHRHNTPMGRDAPIKSLLQGPSRCARINPTTGKPCNTIFSRPYDLTRHEDTIHNTARQKVRCEICNDEKTFSRQDALTRHKKVRLNFQKPNEVIR
jgi:hypothetical protein